MESLNESIEGAKRRQLTPPQKRFIKSDLGGLEDQEIVELLLSLSFPCINCNPKTLSLRCRECRKQAEECVEKFKKFATLRELLSASLQELQQAGIGPRGIFCIKLLHELPAVILKQQIIDKPVYNSAQEVFDYFYYSMRDLEKEVFKVVYLDSQNQIIDTEDLFVGTLDGIHIYPREIQESAIKHKATGLIFVHNHPSGDCTPSQNDKQITRDLVFIGLVLRIKVLDHIIIGENRYFSFADAGLIAKYEDDFQNLRLRTRLALDDSKTKITHYEPSSFSLHFLSG